MASVHDVAAYILDRFGGKVESYKLQKLAYYAQAWSVVWRDEPLVADRFEAWVNGPVARVLYAQNRKAYWGASPLGAGSRLSPDEIAVLDAVIGFYGAWSPQRLVEQTHAEQPWILARGGRGDLDWCDEEIPVESMKRFYAGEPPSRRPSKPSSLTPSELANRPEWKSFDALLDEIRTRCVGPASPKMQALTARAASLLERKQ